MVVEDGRVGRFDCELGGESHPYDAIATYLSVGCKAEQRGPWSVNQSIKCCFRVGLIPCVIEFFRRGEFGRTIVAGKVIIFHGTATSILHHLFVFDEGVKGVVHVR